MTILETYLLHICYALNANKFWFKVRTFPVFLTPKVVKKLYVKLNGNVLHTYSGEEQT